MPLVASLHDLGMGDLALAGGKGANLGALLRTGLPVPPGFCVTTAAYRAFLGIGDLGARIHQTVQGVRPDDPGSLEEAADSVRADFTSRLVPGDLAAEIVQAYTDLSGPSRPGGAAVAVRSSATAEDLPDLSFAGQQDTFLNVVGPADLLDAVVRCWASLWTARALGYRARNGIDHESVALAVVVQLMIPSEVSGVLFTANPLTGRRTETVIDAALGLGEALVSGRVEPDHYVVDTDAGRVLCRTLGAKALSVRGLPGGGTVSRPESAADRQALPDEQILALTRLGRRAEQAFGSPQDLEWAWAEGRLSVVQSRPITSLYPLPANLASHQLQALFSFGAWQGMLDPFTPLGRDLFSYLAVGFGRVFGLERTAPEQRMFLTAGERLFVNLSEPLRTGVGRRIVRGLLPAIDPVSARILDTLVEDPRFASGRNVSARTWWRLLRGFAPFIGNTLYTMLSPARGRARIEARITAELARTESACAAAEDLPALVGTLRSTLVALPQRMMPRLVAGVASGQIPYQVLRRRAGVPEAGQLVMELSLGLPHNVTTGMNLDLWRAARAIRADPASAGHCTGTGVDTLAAEYARGTLPPVAQSAVRGFLTRYGMRGIAEIDIGRPRWREDPSALFDALRGYLGIPSEASPEAAFRQGGQRAAAARERLLQLYRRTPHGALKALLIRGVTNRYRELGGLRETPKFFIVRILGYFRQALLTAGARLADSDVLSRPDDVMFLRLEDLAAIGSDASTGGTTATAAPVTATVRNWKAVVADRRADYERERRRTQVPRILLSDGTAFHEPPATTARSTQDGPRTLTGSPVSVGSVTGTVRVVLNPRDTRLAPGEILVCRATDPAWTPLFLTAGGLILEVGGMMTHGSVVAREYGLPAVVGVTDATKRLHTGELVQVDGTRGLITVLEAATTGEASAAT
jgi:phosphohistidine swiveling domain-containing protein